MKQPMAIKRAVTKILRRENVAPGKLLI